MSAFGTIVLPSQIENVVKTTFSTWMDTYLREMERRSGRQPGALPSIRSWELASGSDERVPEQQIPGVQITWEAMPTEQHADSLASEIAVGVEVMVQTTSFEAVRGLAELYTVALGLIAVQKIIKDPLVCSVSPPQLGIPAETGADKRWRAVGTVDFDVYVDKVMDPNAGPLEPDSGPVPPGDYPTVNEVVINEDLEIVGQQ